ncbi:hypothetical protein ACLKA6_012956 [Drosophila palustris]
MVSWQRLKTMDTDTSLAAGQKEYKCVSANANATTKLVLWQVAMLDDATAAKGGLQQLQQQQQQQQEEQQQQQHQLQQQLCQVSVILCGLVDLWMQALTAREELHARSEFLPLQALQLVAVSKSSKSSSSTTPASSMSGLESSNANNGSFTSQPQP